MLPIHVRRFVGGAMPPSSPGSRHSSRLWWLLFILMAALAMLFASPARGATVSGEVALGQRLTLRPMLMYSMSLTPTTAIGGNLVSGTAKLECQAGPGPVTVSLARSNAAAANPIAASVSVPVG